MSDKPITYAQGLEELLWQRGEKLSAAEARIRELEQERERNTAAYQKLWDKHCELQAQLQAVTQNYALSMKTANRDIEELQARLAQLQARNRKLVTCLEKVQFMVDRNSKSRTLIDAALADEENQSVQKLEKL